MWVFATTIFLSAFLLFQIQPLIGKYILPWFGGTPAVWSTCMLFFQVLLLGGYAYAHGLASKLNPKRQTLLHSCLLAVALLLMVVTAFVWPSPITPGAEFKPVDSSLPIPRILMVLALGVGLPYFLLSTTGPLVQSWFAKTYPTRSPYRLYVLSNVGSLLALISYPFLFEPVMSVTTQSNAWSVGFGVFSLMTIGLATYVSRSLSKKGAEGLAGVADASQVKGASGEGGEAAAAAEPEESAPTFGRKMLWMGLAAVASLMLLATTNQMCQEVAVIPFLWILPLLLYLLTFIIVFAGDKWTARGFWMPALAATTAATLWAMFEGVGLGIIWQVVIYSLNMFVTCMVMHGEMVRLRPHPRYLTSFYLMMSLGGALGGLFVSAVAPFVFLGFWELHVGIGLAWALSLGLLYAGRKGERRRVHVAVRAARIAVGTGMIVVMCVLGYHVYNQLGNTVFLSRNFYGLLRVKREISSQTDREYNKLTHGAITHGLQYTDPALRCVPTTYYGPTTGAGLAINFHPKRLLPGTADHSLNIAAIGMGTGTLAALGEPGDHMRFYEINPEVIQISKGDQAVFTYANECPAQVDVVEGDARITLEREVAEGGGSAYDVMLLDAFSSDSIPVHLLTVEAVELYLKAMKPDGILVVHISNRHLDLKPVVYGIAEHLGLRSVVVDYDTDSSHDLYGATWMILTRNDAFFEEYPASDLITQQEPPTKQVPLWTDDYSNLSMILK